MSQQNSMSVAASSPLDHIVMCGDTFWSDDFDMDLLNILPALKDKEVIKKAMTTYLYTYANDGEHLSHPSVWSSCGALFFSEPPRYQRDKYGWVSIDGCVTNGKIYQVSIFNTIRDQWAHNYPSFIDMKPWSPGISYNRVFYPIMAHLREWQKVEHVQQLLHEVDRWATKGCSAGLRMLAY